MADIDHNKALINRFYIAFQEKNAAAMNACYAQDATFEDPAFGKLNGDQARAMWAMLVERGGKELAVTHKITDVSKTYVSATWEAIYPFSQTLRMVHNKISAEFVIENGLKEPGLRMEDAAGKNGVDHKQCHKKQSFQ